jgi:hypothetical protein
MSATPCLTFRRPNPVRPSPVSQALVACGSCRHHTATDGRFKGCRPCADSRPDAPRSLSWRHTQVVPFTTSPPHPCLIFRLVRPCFIDFSLWPPAAPTQPHANPISDGPVRSRGACPPLARPRLVDCPACPDRCRLSARLLRFSSSKVVARLVRPRAHRKQYRLPKRLYVSDRLGSNLSRWLSPIQHG